MMRHPGHVFRIARRSTRRTEADTDGIRGRPAQLRRALAAVGAAGGVRRVRRLDGCASGRPHRFDAATLAALRLVADPRRWLSATRGARLVRERDRAEAASGEGQFRPT